MEPCWGLALLQYCRPAARVCVVDKHSKSFALIVLETQNLESPFPGDLSAESNLPNRIARLRRKNVVGHSNHSECSKHSSRSLCRPIWDSAISVRSTSVNRRPNWSNAHNAHSGPVPLASDLGQCCYRHDRAQNQMTCFWIFDNLK